MLIRCKLLRDTSRLPEYGSAGAAGADLFADNAEPITILPGKRGLVPTGLAMAIPVGWEMQIRPRSGIALKQGVTVLNSPGTIDSDYRGEVGVILVNQGAEPLHVTQGMKIAQAVLSRAPQAAFMAADDLDGTARGEGGFGSTGT